MAYQLFAAIHAGSGEVSMKVYEISRKNGIREIDQVRYYIELGSDTYSTGAISHDRVYELCKILGQFKNKLEEYKIEHYLAYGGSAIREAANGDMIIDQIKIKTGLHVETINHTQQTFIMMKSIAGRLPQMEQLLQEGTATVDMGAGSLQVSIYQNGNLMRTQNMKLGSLRIREILASLEGRSENFVTTMEDYISNDVDTFSSIFMEECSLKNIIATGEEMLAISKIAESRKMGKAKDEVWIMDKKDFMMAYDVIVEKTSQSLSMSYDLPYELATLLKPAAIVYRKIFETSGADRMYVVNADLCSGMAYQTAWEWEKIKPAHSFENDIICYAKSVARRYKTNKEHTEIVEKMADILFESVRKTSGMTDRDRLLLRLSCILHDCGKYINMSSSGRYSSQIVLGTEFIGLSVQEIRMIACIILYNDSKTIPDRESLIVYLSGEDYMRMLKLTAILRLANGMDRSHRQKIEKIKVSIREAELVITADTLYDLTLEQSVMEQKSDFFEEIYGLHPILRQKRR